VRTLVFVGNLSSRWEVARNERTKVLGHQERYSKVSDPEGLAGKETESHSGQPDLRIKPHPYPEAQEKDSSQWTKETLRVSKPSPGKISQKTAERIVRLCTEYYWDFNILPEQNSNQTHPPWMFPTQNEQIFCLVYGRARCKSVQRGSIARQGNCARR